MPPRCWVAPVPLQDQPAPLAGRSARAARASGGDMRMRRALGGAAATAAVLAVAIGAGPAQAGAPLDQGTFHDVDPGTSTAGDPEWRCTDLGFDVTISLDLHGNY